LRRLIFAMASGLSVTVSVTVGRGSTRTTPNDCNQSPMNLRYFTEGFVGVGEQE
jgi:hypothetical protein